MNNITTGKLTAIVAVLMAATLVVGTFATVAAVTQQSAFAVAKKPPGHDGSKEKTRDDSGSGNGNGNGNTVTIEECKNKGSASGFDTALDQECENLICTHPGNNATCTQEGVTSTPTATTIQVSGQGEGQNFCPNAAVSLPASLTFSAQQSGSAAVQGQFTVTVPVAPGAQIIKTGTLDSVQIIGNSFTITGTELSQAPVQCGDIQLPTSATISGQCGTGVTIQFATADGEHATFTNANVECTTT
jgi:hypothetical protein